MHLVGAVAGWAELEPQRVIFHLAGCHGRQFARVHEQLANERRARPAAARGAHGHQLQGRPRHYGARTAGLQGARRHSSGCPSARWHRYPSAWASYLACSVLQIIVGYVAHRHKRLHIDVRGVLLNVPAAKPVIGI